MVEREQEAQVRQVRFEQRQPSKIVRAVAGDDAEPGIEQVVGLLEEAAVVHGQRLHRLGGLLLSARGSVAVQDQRQRALAEEVAVDFELREASPSWRTVALAESSTSISSGRVSGDT